MSKETPLSILATVAAKELEKEIENLVNIPPPPEPPIISISPPPKSSLEPLPKGDILPTDKPSEEPKAAEEDPEIEILAEYSPIRYASRSPDYVPPSK